MVSTIYEVSGVNALSENNAYENKNIGDNGSKSATCSQISADRLTKELSKVLSF